MLRSQREIALQEVTEACAAARDMHRHLAEIAEGPLGEKLGELARARTDLGARLREAVRNLGCLPREPDPDRETAAELAAAARARLAREGEPNLRARAREAEEELAARLRSALGFELSDHTRVLLEASLAEVEGGLHRLTGKRRE